MTHIDLLESEKLKNTIRQYSGSGTYTALSHARRQIISIAHSVGGNIMHPLPTLHAEHAMITRFGPDDLDAREWCQQVNELCTNEGLAPIFFS